MDALLTKSTTHKKAITDRYLMKIAFKYGREIADLQKEVNPINDQINAIISDFKKRTNKNIGNVTIEKQGNTYNLIMEIY